MMIQAIRLTGKKAALAVILAGAVLAPLILLLGRGSERFQQIGGRSLASPTDAELMAEALQSYDASRKPGEASCSGKIAG